jgi:hypothetical protein
VAEIDELWESCVAESGSGEGLSSSLYRAGGFNLFSGRSEYGMLVAEDIQDSVWL